MGLPVFFYAERTLHLNNQELSIPNPRKDGELRLKFDMRKVFAADARVEEIAFVTPQRGPELMALFSGALRDLSGFLAQLHYHSAVAAKKVRERRAVVVCEVIPTKLAEKKLSNNDSTREAIVELDPEYSAVSDVELEIEAAYIYVREKFRSTESHLNAVKKSMDATSDFLNFAQNPNLIQTPTSPYNPPEVTTARPVTTYSNIQVGKAKY